MALTDTDFPVEYLEALDEVLMGATYASKYQVTGAEFVNARQVKVPEIDFGASPEPTAYSRFKTESDVTIKRTVYTLDNDKEKAFYLDALDTIDEAAIDATKVVSEYERMVLAPYIDKDFFKGVAAKAGTKATETLTTANIKQELRKVRTKFMQSGLSGGDLYMTSTALGLLEDATDRQWSNDTSITDTVGSYDGFTIYEVPDDVLQADFTAITGGQSTVRYITKRAVNYMFAPGQHTSGDGWLTQMRWVYGLIALKNKTVGIYTSKAAGK